MIDFRAQFAEAETQLAHLDPRLGRLIELQRPIYHEPRGDYFASLCRTIIGQQVSVASAAAIYARFETASGLRPEAVAGLSPDDIKAIGLSRQKSGYLHDLAVHFVEHPETYQHLDGLADDEVVAQLTAIKGIGVWSARMFLMFTLSRLDVFAPDDIGLQRAMKQLFGWSEVPPAAELVATAERWRPYRTVACWHLWRSLHNEPA